MIALVLRRSGMDRAEPNAALTRWRITPAPSPNEGDLGMGRARWNVELLRCRGAESHSWMLEACDAKGRLALPAAVSDRSAAAEETGAPARDRPLVTVVQDGNRRVHRGVDEAARLLRLRPGMTVTHAQSLVPDLVVIDATPDEDEAALTQLALWCTRYSPLVTPDPPDGVFIDVAGSAHLFKGEAALLEDLAARLGEANLSAKFAIADTPGCAWAVARFGKDRIVSPGRASDAFGQLPVAALRLPARDRGKSARCRDRAGRAARQQAARVAADPLRRRCAAASRSGARHGKRSADLASPAARCRADPRICRAGR